MYHQQDASAACGQTPVPLSAGPVSGAANFEHRPVRQAEARLRQSSHSELRHVRCEFHEGALVLRGRVSSFYLKQLAQTLAAAVPGVQEIVNRIDVREVTRVSA